MSYPSGSALETRINIARIIHQSKVLIFREKSVFFSFQSPKPTNELNFSNFPRIPEISRINLVPGAFLKMVPDWCIIKYQSKTVFVIVKMGKIKQEKEKQLHVNKFLLHQNLMRCALYSL